MLVSYAWLQKYFKDPLPGVERVVEVLTFGVAEVEGFEKRGGDTVIDVKVLPDRAGYLLSHRGVAQELSVLLGIPMQDDPLEKEIPALLPEAEDIVLVVDNPKANPVHTLGVVEGVSVGPSPAWLKEALEVVGQRSINNVVDATNFVLLNLGQPTHAFDLDALSEKNGRGIRVRPSKEGERITLLGGQEIVLPEGVEMLCDVNTNTPLDVAGIKGGVYAELTNNTTRVLLTAATFDPVLIRKTAARLGVKTDAVKRFENAVPQEMPFYGMRAVADLVVEVAGGTVRGFKTIKPPQKMGFKLGVSVDEVNRVLGTNLSDSDIARVFTACGWRFETVENPRARLVAEAEKCIGAAYKADSAFRSDAPQMFSCSSLTNYAAVLAGVSMPSVSVDQYVWSSPVEERDIQPGDLIFSNTGEGKIWYETFQFLPGTPVPEGVDHVGIYVGEGKVLHATRAYGKVVVEAIAESPLFKTIVGYGRVANDGPRFVVDVPFYRSDLRMKEDLIEEVARVYGYEKMVGEVLPTAGAPARIDSTRLEAEMVREALTEAGFVEILTYTLRAEGIAALSNPLASDKAFLRENLAAGIREATEKGEYYLPLTGMREVKVFEVGTVFDAEHEYMHVGVGVRAAPGKKRAERTNAILDQAINILSEIAGVPVGDFVRTEDTIECRLPGTRSAAEYPKGYTVTHGVSYVPLSPYPFVLRDIALWVNEGISPEDILQTITKHAGTQMRRVDMFDEFRKEGRVSYAFHLVFQSHEETLSDDAVNKWMDAIYAACKERGWETR